MHSNSYKPEGAILSTSENREYILSELGLIRAMNEGKILEAIAIRCDENFTLTVDLGAFKGYIDREDVQYNKNGEDVRDIAVITRVGKAVCFKVLGFFTKNGEKAVRLSRREAQRECYENFLHHGGLSLCRPEELHCRFLRDLQPADPRLWLVLYPRKHL